MSGWLSRRDAERGREAAKRATFAPNRKGRKRMRFTVDTKPRLCSCQAPWNGGEGYCLHCGKTMDPKVAGL